MLTLDIKSKDTETAFKLVYRIPGCFGVATSPQLPNKWTYLIHAGYGFPEKIPSKKQYKRIETQGTARLD